MVQRFSFKNVQESDMNFKHLAAVVALVAAGAAQAAGGSLGTSGTSFSSLAAGSTDEWTLTLGANSFGSITAYSTSGGGLASISFTTAGGAGLPTVTSTAFLPFGATYVFTSLAAGNYKVSLSGVGGTTYGISTGISTSPVPEADALALALAGVGVAGLLRRRRAA
jgi:MYXO-CTERM domain-containing protein